MFFHLQNLVVGSKCMATNFYIAMTGKDAWHSYLDHLSLQGMEETAWFARRADLLVELLHNMAQFLGYGFSKSEQDYEQEHD